VIPSTAYHTLVLVRHGEFSPSSLGLTRLGRRQARRTAKRLSHLPVTRIHSSTMKRAWETAIIIAAQLPERELVRAHLLRECLPNLPLSLRRISPEITPDMLRRGKDRVDRAFRRYFRGPAHRDECDVLVSHGNVIRYLAGRTLGLEKYGWHRLGTSHCGITVIRISRDGSCSLDACNDTGHLSGTMRASGTRRDP
jgi:serine/threonine-protein phosphatase PGAM5